MQTARSVHTERSRIHMRRFIPIVATLLACAVVAPSVASATDYPAPENPGTPQPKPKGPFHTWNVCPKLTAKAKKAGCDFAFVQEAVDKAKPGDTIKVADGTYAEGVIVSGPKKRFIKLIGNEKNPRKVLFDANKIPKKLKYVSTTVKPYARQDVVGNAISVQGANGVKMSGFSAINQKANGFFVNRVNDFTMTNLWAQKVGVYGIYVFHSIGGTISNSESSYNNDAGYYIGETPPQASPKRTFVKNVISWGNVLGWSGTNMRYVTISKSYFFNNGAGLVPNALKSEKFAPPEDNVITDNDVFLNNFNYYKGAPFILKPTEAGGVPYPVGVGILVFGGRRNVIQGNRVYGNKLDGLGLLQGLAVDVPESTLVGNQFKDNVLGNGGANRNGRDLFYDGNGTGNCFSGNTGVETTEPAGNGAIFSSGCASATTPNAFDPASQAAGIGWATAKDQSTSWVQYPQAAIKDPRDPSKNVVPLEVYKK
jgi:hypothetical protein